MAEVCEKCANSFEGDSVKCGGFCSSTVCLRCSGIAKNVHASIAANTHLVWLCTACKNLIAKARFSNALVSTNKANECVIDAMKTEIRDSILVDIRNEIRSNFKSLIKSVPPTPAPPRPSPLAPVPRIKRRRTNEGYDETVSNRPTNAFCGIGTSTADPSLVASQPSEQDADKFWLYLSGILPEVPESKVTELVQSKLRSDDLKVVKLVPRGKDVGSLTFVSYKIGISPDLKSVALSTETWPRGIRFREFEDFGSKKQFFWKPTPTTDNTAAENEVLTVAPVFQR